MSRGYVVVTIDHTGEAPVEFPGGRTDARSAVTNEPDVIKRATEPPGWPTPASCWTPSACSAAGRNPDAGQRQLPKGLGRALDLRRTGMFGFSLGGFAAAETMLVDRRVDAGVNLDGTMQYGFPEGELSESAEVLGWTGRSCCSVRKATPTCRSRVPR